MKTLRRTGISMAAVLALSGSAEALTLYSAPLNGGEGRQLACRVLNVSSQAREVTIEMFLSNPVVTLTGPHTFNLAAALANGITHGSTAAAYCKVTIGSSKSNFRMAFTVEQDLGSGDFVTIANTPLE
jgi:hypothetical protein